jgi:hypothetical protein
MAEWENKRLNWMDGRTGAWPAEWMNEQTDGEADDGKGVGRLRV